MARVNLRLLGNFACSTCEGIIGRVVDQDEGLSYEVETVCYGVHLDHLKAGTIGGCEAVVNSREGFWF